MPNDDQKRNHDFEWLEIQRAEMRPLLVSRYIPEDYTLTQAVEAWREAHGGADCELAEV